MSDSSGIALNFCSYCSTTDAPINIISLSVWKNSWIRILKMGRKLSMSQNKSGSSLSHTAML